MGFNLNHLQRATPFLSRVRRQPCRAGKVLTGGTGLAQMAQRKRSRRQANEQCTSDDGVMITLLSLSSLQSGVARGVELVAILNGQLESVQDPCDHKPTISGVRWD